MRPLFILNKKYDNMCLYPRLIKNRRYIPNKKNGGNPPTPNDERVLYVPIGCGNCIECRKQKAREWQVRLNEEIKIHKCKYFVTLTFSEENLQQLAIDAKNTEDNIVAALAVRRFNERWRKRYKKAPIHWYITELGQTSTERLHLHGILFTEFEIDNDTLQSIWQYGYADTGKYVTNRTINYIVKYMTKIDKTHKGYIPQIFCSKGIGSRYIKTADANRRKFNGTNTIEYYTLPNGSKCNMPIYYRNKLYTEQEREQLWLQKLDQGVTYIMGMRVPIKTNEDLEMRDTILEEQQRLNTELGYGDNSKEWKRKSYNITLRKLNAISRLQKLRKNI